MTTLLPAQSNSYRQNVAQVASQAAIHLHNQVGAIGTALFDLHGTLIFNNNVQHYVNEALIVGLIAECLSDLTTIRQRMVGNVTVYAAALDQSHVFVIAGSQCERGIIDQFLGRLRQVLPQTQATND